MSAWCIIKVSIITVLMVLSFSFPVSYAQSLNEQEVSQNSPKSTQVESAEDEGLDDDDVDYQVENQDPTVDTTGEEEDVEESDSSIY